jgi:hypothetical protein
LIPCPATASIEPILATSFKLYLSLVQHGEEKKSEKKHRERMKRKEEQTSCWAREKRRRK